jgi:murein DD-endopeptidase MepM/ murein hydrolase activator NlpD
MRLRRYPLLRPQQLMDAGAFIGLVGNSGNSNEPHLHVHAQRPAAGGHEPLSGDPLPIRFNGRYLVRNDRLTSEFDMADK